MKQIAVWRGNNDILGIGPEAYDAGLWKHAIKTPLKLWNLNLNLTNQGAIDAYAELQAELQDIAKDCDNDLELWSKIEKRNLDGELKMLTAVFATTFPEVADNYVRLAWHFVMEGVQKNIIGKDPKPFIWLPINKDGQTGEGTLSIHGDANEFVEDFVNGAPESGHWAIYQKNEGEFAVTSVDGSKEIAIILDLERVAELSEQNSTPMTSIVIPIKPENFKGGGFQLGLIKLVNGALIEEGFESISEEFSQAAQSANQIHELITQTHHYVRLSI